MLGKAQQPAVKLTMEEYIKLKVNTTQARLLLFKLLKPKHNKLKG
jgi:hypothetical protein